MPSTRRDAILEGLLKKQREIRGEKPETLPIANVNKQKMEGHSTKLSKRKAGKSTPKGEKKRKTQEEQPMEIEEQHDGSMQEVDSSLLESEMLERPNESSKKINRKKGKKSKKSTARRQLELEESPQQKVVAEDTDQMVQMQVNADEDTFGQSEHEESDEDESEEEKMDDSDNELQASQSEVQFKLTSRKAKNRSATKTDAGKTGEDWQNSAPSTSGFVPESRPQDNSSAAQQIKEIDNEMAEKIRDLHQYMMDQGLDDSCELLGSLFDTRGRPRPVNGKGMSNILSGKQRRLNKNRNANVALPIALTHSEATIYENALKKRASSSSEEGIEFSDESLDNPDALLIIDQNRNDGQNQQDDHEELTVEEKVEQIIKEAELAKVKMFPPKGKSPYQNLFIPANGINIDMPPPQLGTVGDVPFEFVARADQDYLMIGAHLDDNIQSKIIKGEYVDFGKLIPKDRIMSEEEDRLELVVRNGRTFWTQVSESITISNFSRWEQAFRVFSNVYTRAHPHRATELIQYNHVIHSISLTYIWENVYSYDKEFRLHLSKHPERNWSVILQQAWSMKLRDRLPKEGLKFSSMPNNTGVNNNEGRSPRSDGCRLFNKGYCKFGASCKFEHKCSYCGKTGHAIIHCRKLQAELERARVKSKSGTTGNHLSKHHKRDNAAE